MEIVKIFRKQTFDTFDPILDYLYRILLYSIALNNYNLLGEEIVTKSCF
jgi:hypothetical protein